MSPLIQRMASSLAGIVASEAVEIRGAWTTSHRRTYEDPAQVGSGSPPFVEVTDTQWTGTLECEVPLAGIAFLVTPGRIYWAKSPPATMNPEISVSIHARAEDLSHQASFAAGLNQSFLPAVPFSCGKDPIGECTLGSMSTVTGRAHGVAEVKDAAFVVILLPASVMEVGRKRLWRMRSELTASLPEDLRDLFGRGRTGVLGSA